MTGGVGSSNVAAGAELINQVLASAQQKSADAAEKQMKMAVEARLGTESGKGGQVDLVA